jgi:hypothetical protein
VPRGVRVVLAYQGTAISSATGRAVFDGVFAGVCIDLDDVLPADTVHLSTGSGRVGPGGQSTGPLECASRSTLWTTRVLCGWQVADQKKIAAVWLASSLLIKVHANFHANELPLPHTRKTSSLHRDILAAKRGLDWRMYTKRLEIHVFLMSGNNALVW